MKPIICELCGNNQLIKQDGMFVCEYCGTKYTLEEAKKLIVSGAVELVHGDLEKERLLKNAETFISLNEVEKAQSIYKQIANEYPSDYRGWFGLACIAQKEIDKNFSQIASISEDISFASLQYTIKVGNDLAVKILKQFSDLYNYYKKLAILEATKANEISKYEKTFITTYRDRKLPFINWLSANILTRYETIIQCSPTIQKWADEMVDDYINKFELGELDELYWRVKNPYEKIELYPSAIAFLQKAYNNAQLLNNLSTETQSNLLHYLVTQKNTYSNKCVFWLNKTIIFIDKYSSSSFLIQRTKIELNSQNVDQFVNSIITEINTKCQEASELLYNVRYRKSVLEELLTKFTNAKIKTSSLKSETNFSYEITKIKYCSIEYITTYKYYDKIREEQCTAVTRAETNFDDILTILRKYNYKCSYCGGHFKIFTKTCSKCGKLKNY